MKKVYIEFNAIPVPGGFITPLGRHIGVSTYTTYVSSIDDLHPMEKVQVLDIIASMQSRIRQLECEKVGVQYNSNYSKLPSVKVLLHSIIETVSETFSVSFDEMKSKNRKREMCKARFFCMTLIRVKTGMSLKKIGKIFNRDHTSVMHAVNEVRDWVDVDENLKQRLEELMNYNYLATAQSSLQIA